MDGARSRRRDGRLTGSLVQGPGAGDPALPLPHPHPMNWVCDIPGASTVVSTLHFTLHLGLAAAVVLGGTVFLALGLRAYRMPPGGRAATWRSRRESGAAVGVPGDHA